MAHQKKILREKFEALNRLLDDQYALIHIDPKHDGVVIPDFLQANPTVTLKLSRLFRGSLSFDEETIVAELLFNNSYFTCTIPLSALWGITSAAGSNLVWPESCPPSVIKSLTKLTTTAPAEAPAEKSKPKRAEVKASFKVTPGSKPSEEGEEKEDSEPPPQKPRGSHLKRVK